MFRWMLIFAYSLVTMNATHAEPQWQTHESIYEVVKSYVAHNINTTAEYEINVVPLIDRLNLPLCPQSIQAFAPNLPKAGRMSINVRCNGDKRWSIFVSITITPFENVVVLTQALQRGEQVTDRHLTLARKDVSQLHDAYLTQIEYAINKQMARNLGAGSIVTAKDFIEPKLVKRGERVLITSDSAGIAIKMNGIAQTDGSKGQVIRVKNQNSEKIINATVTDVGQVSVSK